MWNRTEPFDEAGRKGQTKQVDHVSSDPGGHSEFLVSRGSNPGGIFSSRSDECEREDRAMLRSQLVDCFDAVRREYVARIAGLAREKFAPRADGYDRAAAFPAEDFED